MCLWIKTSCFECRLLLHKTLISFGFSKLQSDECIYLIKQQSHCLYLGVYVDDVLCLGMHQDIVSWFQNSLSQHFSITINIKISSFLGVHIDHDIPNKIISVYQLGYIETILEKFKIGPISHKSNYHKIPFSSSDLVDDNPIPLTKHDQSLYL